MDGGDNGDSGSTGDSGITGGIETPLRKEEELTDPFILINKPIILFVILLSFFFHTKFNINIILLGIMYSCIYPFLLLQSISKSNFNLFIFFRIHLLLCCCFPRLKLISHILFDESIQQKKLLFCLFFVIDSCFLFEFTASPSRASKY